MGTLVADRIERPLSLFDQVEAPVPARAPERQAAVGQEQHVHDGVGGEPTLDDVIVGAWEGLIAQAAVACPLCEGTLRPLYGDAGGASPPIAARCDRCATTLS